MWSLLNSLIAWLHVKYFVIITALALDAVESLPAGEAVIAF